MDEQFVQYDLLKISDCFKMPHDIKSQPMQHDKKLTTVAINLVALG